LDITTVKILETSKVDQSGYIGIAA
jgi:hypothetical protein